MASLSLRELNEIASKGGNINPPPLDPRQIYKLQTKTTNKPFNNIAYINTSNISSATVLQLAGNSKIPQNSIIILTNTKTNQKYIFKVSGYFSVTGGFTYTVSLIAGSKSETFEEEFYIEFGLS